MKKIYLLLFFACFLFSLKAQAQCTPVAVPYMETFQNLSNGQLPACWAVSNTVTCSTYTVGSGGSRAYFYSSPSGNNYFYSRAVQLNSGITYSAGIWFVSGGSFSYNSNWTNLSVSYGLTPSSSANTVIATINGTLAANVFTALSNTFTVPSSGTYYFIIKATSTGGSGVSQLDWNDFFINIPCTAAYNTPTLTIVSSPTILCAGDTFTGIATGADTYSWSSGQSTSTLSDVPLATTYYSVAGTSTLTGCSQTKTISVVVNPSPNVVVYSPNMNICAGTSAYLTAYGAASYSWSNGSQSSAITVTPALSTGYTVVGTNTYNCSGIVSLNIHVNPLPVITATNNPNEICSGEEMIITASGANTYTWNTMSQMYAGSSITVSPVATTVYTVTGVDNNGCSNRTTIIANVNVCAGIPNLRGAGAMQLYPNPTAGIFYVTSDVPGSKQISVLDISGKEVLSYESNTLSTKIDLNGFSSGVYYVRVLSGTSEQHFKLIRN